MKRALTLFLLLVAALFAAHTEGCREKSESKWDYTIEITSTGSRSEGKIGRLFYGGREVGSFFEIMIIDDAIYEYVNREYLWDFGGYKVSDGLYEETHEGMESVTKQELSLGWYEAEIGNKKKKTPSDWIWTKRGMLEAFLDPEKMEDFIGFFSLEKIGEREGTLLPELMPIKK